MLQGVGMMLRVIISILLSLCTYTTCAIFEVDDGLTVFLIIFSFFYVIVCFDETMPKRKVVAQK
jgi:hypothetical protein